MPAVSKAQQALFGMAYAVRKGEMKRSEVHKEVLDIVDSDMTDKQIKDFASTSRKSLKESLLDALDDKKMNDLANNAIRAEMINARKRVYRHRAVHGYDYLGNQLKEGDKVLIVNFEDNAIRPVVLVKDLQADNRHASDKWMTDITSVEAQKIFDFNPNDYDAPYIDDHYTVFDYQIICKINNVNKIK